MASSLISVFLFLSSFCIYVCLCWPTTTSLETVRFVDDVDGNLFYRGGSPVDSATLKFSYENLVKALDEQWSLPEYFLVASINLLDSSVPSEALLIAIEENYWDANPGERFSIALPSKGTRSTPYLNAELGIAFHDPSRVNRNYAVNASYYAAYSANFSAFADDLPKWVDLICGLRLTETAGMPIVVYAHCAYGGDRAAELASAYALRYLRIPLARLRDYNIAISQREMSAPTAFALQMYCFFISSANDGAVDCAWTDDDSIYPRWCPVAVFQTFHGYRITPYYHNKVAWWSVTILNVNRAITLTDVPLRILTGGSRDTASLFVTVFAYDFGMKDERHVGHFPESLRLQGGIYPGTSYNWHYYSKHFEVPIRFAPLLGPDCANPRERPADELSCHIELSKGFMSQYALGDDVYQRYAVDNIYVVYILYLYYIRTNVDPRECN